MLTAKRTFKLLLVLMLCAWPAVVAIKKTVKVTKDGFPEENDPVHLTREDEIEFDWEPDDFPSGGLISVTTTDSPEDAQGCRSIPNSMINGFNFGCDESGNCIPLTVAVSIILEDIPIGSPEILDIYFSIFNNQEFPPCVKGYFHVIVDTSETPNDENTTNGDATDISHNTTSQNATERDDSTVGNAGDKRSRDNNESTSSNKGVLTAVIICAIAGAVAFGLELFWVMRRRQRGKELVFGASDVSKLQQMTGHCQPVPRDPEQATPMSGRALPDKMDHT